MIGLMGEKKKASKDDAETRDQLCSAGTIVHVHSANFFTSVIFPEWLESRNLNDDYCCNQVPTIMTQCP